MKKTIAFFVFFLCGFCFALCGCENGNMLRTVTFSEATSAGSDKYVVKVVFAEDKRELMTSFMICKSERMEI